MTTHRPIIQAALDEFGASKSAAFCLPIPNTTPPVFIVGGGREQIAKLVASQHCQCPACRGGTIHASDCAVHGVDTGAGIVRGLCDCGANPVASRAGSEPVKSILQIALENIACEKPRRESASELVGSPERIRCFHCGFAWQPDNKPFHAFGCAYVEASEALAASIAPAAPTKVAEPAIDLHQTSPSAYYLWEHPELTPRVARPEDADFARGEPKWVRCYPVDLHQEAGERERLQMAARSFARESILIAFHAAENSSGAEPSISVASRSLTDALAAVDAAIEAAPTTNKAPDLSEASSGAQTADTMSMDGRGNDSASTTAPASVDELMALADRYGDWCVQSATGLPSYGIDTAKRLAREALRAALARLGAVSVISAEPWLKAAEVQERLKGGE